MKPLYAAALILACFLLTGVLERQWQPDLQHRGTTLLTAHSDARIASNAEASAPALSMPCTWVCQGSEIKCAQIKNRQCVNASQK